MVEWLNLIWNVAFQTEKVGGLVPILLLLLRPNEIEIDDDDYRIHDSLKWQLLFLEIGNENGND